MRVLSLPVVLALVGAGCLGAADAPVHDEAAQTTVPDPFAALAELLVDLPCEATKVGGGTSDNLRELANVAYEGGTHGEIDVAGDWMLSARYQDGGLELVSLHDPQNPLVVATWQSKEDSAYDVKWMPDLRSAVVGHGGHVSLVDLGPVLDEVAGGASPEAVREAGIVPVLVSEWEYPDPGVGTNMHMLATKRIGETDYLFVAPNDNTGVWIAKLVGEGEARAFEVVTNVGEPVGGGPLGPHDMSLFDDEILGKPILYVANGFEGWQAWDVSDPASPVRLALVPNVGVGAAAYTHSIVAHKVGDRRLVATIGEVGANTLKIHDATDFSAPVLLAEWWAEKAAPHHPQHNMQVVDGRLYLAHYTHGVYVFDLAKAGTTPLAGSASFTPMAQYAPPQPESGNVLGFANVWDVNVHRGLVYVNDVVRGTAVVAFGCLTPGDELQSGTS